MVFAETKPLPAPYGRASVGLHAWVGHRLLEPAAVLLAGERGRAAAGLEQLGSLVVDVVDLLAQVVEGDLDRGVGELPGKHVSHTDRGVRVGDLPLQPFLEPEETVEVRGGEEAVDVDEAVVGADPIDAAVALHEAHRVPGQVDADDVPGLLEVHALRQDVGGEQDIEQILRIEVPSSSRIPAVAGTKLASVLARAS